MKTIRFKVKLPASPQEVFDMLLDSKKHSAITGDVAKISRKVGGKFSAFSGYATGKNLELVKDKKVVQTWHASDWPQDAVSEVTFALKATKTGSTLTFTHKNVPDEFYKDVQTGWKDYYWEPMKKLLEKKK